MIENDEAGIDGNETAIDMNRHRVGMTPDPVGALIYSHVVPRAEQPGRGQSGNTGADDRNLEALTVPHI